MNRQEPPVARVASRAVQTSCGRELVVGQLRLDGMTLPVRRVTLAVECQAYDHDEVWASLTVTEARRLAGLLLAQAARLDKESGAT